MNVSELITALEKAEEGSRVLDAMVTVAVYKRKHDDYGEFAKLPTPYDQCAQGTYWLCSRSGNSLQTAEPVTTSLDAAVALCERLLPGSAWDIYSDGTGSVWIPGEINISAEAKIPALALCLATLRAHTQETPDG